MITALQDTHLVARIGGEDLVAKEMKYHLKCLTTLRNRYRSHIRKLNQDENKQSLDEVKMKVFIELVSYIEKSVDSGILLFKLSEVHSLYVNCLKDFGINKTINNTKLKETLMKHFPGAQEQCVGRSTVIVFNKAMQSLLREVRNGISLKTLLSWQKQH